MSDSPFDKKSPELTFPRPRESNTMIGMFAILGMASLAYYTEGPWNKLLFIACTLYAVWRYFADGREHTIARLEYRRALQATWAAFQADSERAQSSAYAEVARDTEKIEMMRSSWWRLSEPVTLGERHEREIEAQYEKKLMRRLKKLKVGMRIAERYGSELTWGSVIRVDKGKSMPGFLVKWDNGEEYWHSLGSIEDFENIPK